MGLKFNCHNPECRQRIEVDDALAGATTPCPACGTELHVPKSHDIRFTCHARGCGQHIVVDVSEAGRFVKCPACGKPQRIPGDPPKALVPRPEAKSDNQKANEALPEAVWRAPLKRLAWGWGAGAVLSAVLWLGFHLYGASALPSHLEATYDEIEARSTAATNAPPVASVFSQWVEPVIGAATNASGEAFEYYFVPPAVLEPGRKYPVVIDQSSSIKNNRMRDIQFLANAGVFYVSPNAYGIIQWGIVPEERNVLAVCAELAKNPHVDTNRFYVMGQSRTVGAAIGLVNVHPGLWRGAILMEPAGAFPRIPADAKDFPSIFMSLGRDDKFNQGPLGRPGVAEKNLLKASASLIPARIDYQNGDHGYPPEELKRAYIAAVKFILTDY